MKMRIIEGNLDHPQVIDLISDHLKGMEENSPKESIHALGLSKLKAFDITFYGLWNENQLAGCGAMKELDGACGEVKSMRTNQLFLRQGVARKILLHIISEAKKRGYKSLYLETGTAEAFKPAQKLYEKEGFTYCGPFGDYIEDPNSTYMMLKL